jgi:serine/threonine-protein kinase
MFDNTGKIIGISVVVSLIISIIVSLVMVVFVAPLIKTNSSKENATETKVEVPQIEGIDFERGKLVLANKGLLLYVESEKTSETAAKGIILSQSPIAGAMADKNSAVNVVISAGSEIIVPVDTQAQEAKLILVPYFAGLNVDEVKREIIKLRLKIGSTVYVDNEKYRTDVVVSTEPEGGAEVPEGSSINITISKGTVSVVMPNVNNLTKSDAIDKIKSAGLTVQEIINITDIELPFDIVIKQSVEPGAKVKKGTGVKIWMNTERK